MGKKKTLVIEGHVFENCGTKRQPVYVIPLETNRRTPLEVLIRDSGIFSKMISAKDHKYELSHRKWREKRNWRYCTDKQKLRTLERTDVALIDKTSKTSHINTEFVKKNTPKVKVTITVEEIK